MRKINPCCIGHHDEVILADQRGPIGKIQLTARDCRDLKMRHGRTVVAFGRMLMIASWSSLTVGLLIEGASATGLIVIVDCRIGPLGVVPNSTACTSNEPSVAGSSGLVTVKGSALV